jgi:hypothetical protein
VKKVVTFKKRYGEKDFDWKKVMKISICGIPDGTFSCEKTAVKKRLPRSMPRRAFLSFTWSCSMSRTWKRNQIAKNLQSGKNLRFARL